MASKEGAEKQVERDKSNFLFEESVKYLNCNYKIQLYNDCIELVKETEDDTEAERVLWDDVLKVTESQDTTETKDETSFSLHYIKNLGHVPPDKKGLRWKHIQKTFFAQEGRDHVTMKLKENIEELLSLKVNGRPRNLLILINPRSGDFKAESIYNDKVAPLMGLMDVTVDKVVLEGVEQTRKMLNEYDFTKVDGVVAMGGDGTMADVINTVVLRYQREAGNNVDNAKVAVKPIPVKLGILPAGSGQGNTLILNGSFDAETAALHIVKGATMKGDLYTCHNNDKWVSSGILGGGLGYLADLLVYSESKRWWLGTWRYFVAFLQTLWYLDTFDADIEVLKSTDNGQEEWEKISGKFMEIDISPGPIGYGCHFAGVMECLTQKSASRGETMKYVGKLVNAEPELYNFPHVTALKAKEVRITLPHIENMKKGIEDKTKIDISLPGSVIHLDGEIYPIIHPQITFRLHRQVLTFFGMSREAAVILNR